jgi:hypothetical protein
MRLLSKQVSVTLLIAVNNWQANCFHFGSPADLESLYTAKKPYFSTENVALGTSTTKL